MAMNTKNERGTYPRSLLTVDARSVALKKAKTPTTVDRLYILLDLADETRQDEIKFLRSAHNNPAAAVEICVDKRH